MFVTLGRYDKNDKQDFLSSATSGNEPNSIKRGWLVYQETPDYQSFGSFNEAVSAWANLNGPSESKMLVSDIWMQNNVPSKKYGRTDYYQFRMQGYLIPPDTGTYRLYIQTDDGFAMRIGDNQYYVPCCYSSWDGARQFDVDLVRGHAYEFDLFYYELYSSAYCILGWKRPGEASVEEVPASVFGYKRAQLKRDFTY